MSTESQPLRTLFCSGVLPPFYDLGDTQSKGVCETLKQAYADIRGRSGITSVRYAGRRPGGGG
jgi:hypothetical protein